MISNSLTDLPFRAVSVIPHLKTLTVAFNQIRSALPIASIKLPKLEKLDISFNNIKLVDKGIVPMLPALKTLDLTSNPIPCNCQHTWLRNMSDCICVMHYGNCRDSKMKNYTLIDYKSEGCQGADFVSCKVQKCEVWTGTSSSGIWLPIDDTTLRRATTTISQKIGDLRTTAASKAAEKRASFLVLGTLLLSLSIAIDRRPS